MNAPTGFTARPGTLEDAAAAAELMNAFDRAYLEEPDTVDAAEVAGWWARIELDLDSRFYFDAQHRLAGIAALYSRNEGRLDLDGYVLPEQAGNGLGGAMIDWLEEETTHRGAEIARTSVITADRAAARLLGDRGYGAGQALLPDVDRAGRAATRARVARGVHCLHAAAG